jgi:hypothetical protein
VAATERAAERMGTADTRTEAAAETEVDDEGVPEAGDDKTERFSFLYDGCLCSILWAENVLFVAVQ